MKVLGICASLREASNTNKLVEIVAQASGKEYELIYLKDKKISACTGCYNCMMNEGECAIKDDMQEIYPKMLECSAMIFGAPTYYMDVSGIAKCFIDRTMALYYRGIGPDAELEVLGKRPLAGKPAIAVTTVAGDGHKRAMETLRIYFEINKMNIIGELAEIVGMGDVNEMPEVIKRAEEMGKKLGNAL
ncbi:MAG: NADPH-dependent oxidoreductase [Candidatus Schekmanbacteria bacterium]|nr:MAG: NADPH-dependent oxidoreductase [Candidatus Schekmanbacteria bacterium]